MTDEIPAFMFAQLVSKNYSFAFFIFCALSKDIPSARWFEGMENRISAPCSPEILETYAEHIRKKFPRLGNSAEYEIKELPEDVWQSNLTFSH